MGDWGITKGSSKKVPCRVWAVEILLLGLMGRDYSTHILYIRRKRTKSVRATAKESTLEQCDTSINHLNWRHSLTQLVREVATNGAHGWISVSFLSYQVCLHSSVAFPSQPIFVLPSFLSAASAFFPELMDTNAPLHSNPFPSSSRIHSSLTPSTRATDSSLLHYEATPLYHTNERTRVNSKYSTFRFRMKRTKHVFA